MKMSAIPLGLDEFGDRAVYLELDDDVLFLRVRRGKRTVGNSLGNDKHLARLQRDIAQLCLPMDRPLIAKNEVVAVHVAMPEVHGLFGPLGKVKADAFSLKQRQDCAFGTRIIGRSEERRVGKEWRSRWA